MVDIHSIIASHLSKNKDGVSSINKTQEDDIRPSMSSIPDLFFDQILIKHKLTRIEILVMMYMYRQVYCRPNLFRMYGLTPVMSHKKISDDLGVSLDDFYQAVKKLEDLTMLETIRSGQYFIRKYFSQELDVFYKQNYDTY